MLNERCQLPPAKALKGGASLRSGVLIFKTTVSRDAASVEALGKTIHSRGLTECGEQKPRALASTSTRDYCLHTFNGNSVMKKHIDEF